MVVNATVNKFHVEVNFFRGENPHASPTNVRFALWAGHMVAASAFLDQNFALWAPLDVLIMLGPTIQQPLLCPRISVNLPLTAAEPIVFLLTGNADGREARSALENSISGFEGVDFGTVGSGAIFELMRMVTEIFEEGNFQQVFELGGKEESLYGGKGDWDTTFPLIAHAQQREVSGVGGGEKEVTNTPVTISVAASKTIRLIDRVATDWASFSVLELMLRSDSVGQRLANELMQTMSRRFSSTNDNLARDR